jgi:hypothetical protein
MKRLRSKLTYSNVISTFCLVLLLGGGTAYAATQVLPKNSVGSKQIKKAAITPAKLSTAAKATLTGPVGPAGTKGVTGATGLQGPKGDTGPEGKPGDHGYFAIVNGGGFVGAHVGFTGVTERATGAFCLALEPGVSYYYPIASVEWADSSGSNLLVEPLGQEESNECSSGELEVRTFTLPGGTATPSSSVVFTIFLPQS